MYNTFSSTAPPSSTIGMDKRYRFRRIKAIEILNLPPEWDKRSYYLKVFAGNVYEKTKTYKVKKKDRGTTSIPRWTLDLDLRGINESERFQVEVYCRRGEGEYRCLGFCGASIQDVLIGETEIIIMSVGSNSSHPNVSLKIFREGGSDYSSIAQSASEDHDMAAAPQSGPSNTADPESQDTSDLSGLQPEETFTMSVEDYQATAEEVVGETVKLNFEHSEWMSRLIDGFDIVKSVIDACTSAHPAASIAWGVISPCVSILKQRIERDNTVLRLYEAMITTYKEASNYRQLWQEERLQPIYKALFQTTSDCGMFIKRYTNKNRIKRLLLRNMTENAEEFIQGFANLRKQLKLGVAKDALVVTLGVRANVDILTIRGLLQPLGHKQELGPKSTCMPGTRKETIKYLLTWITDCDDSILWCSGLAGTGKSSLVGTLHNLLSFHMSGRSRLAAFIRYDRTSYRDSSGLITSIAYSLAMFDRRIGNAIAQALTASPAAAKLPASESRTQFRFLVQEPLETIPELQDEGPLVVIIDGLDESDVSTELLEVLADGFGPELPFMRLIISSRPEEKIARIFKNRLHVHPYPLDTSSDEVKQDIQYFIRQRFASINDESVWGTCHKEDVITSLAGRASGLFIWAVTVCLFLCNFPSSKRLEALLNTTIPADAMEAMTILYQTALDAIASEVPGEDVRQCIRAVLGALIVRKGKMTVPMLPELVLQQGDPRAQLIVARLGSVVQERSDRSLELIHKSFDDFLQDLGRCGDGWFIDVEEHEQKLAQRCLSSLMSFFKNWTPTRVQFEPILSDINLKKTIQDRYHHVVPSHIQHYAMNILKWHPDAFVELGINTYHPLFDRYFLFWLEILYAFNSQPYLGQELLEVISVVNAEVTDQSLRTYVYHAFIFWKRFNQFSTKYTRVNPAYVYTHAMTISPSANFICRDWGESSGVNIPFDKERLLALTPCNEILTNHSGECFYIFQGSRHIQFKFLLEPSNLESRHQKMFSSRGSVLFNVDTGRILDPSPPLILCFPNLQLPFEASAFYESFGASGQIVRLIWWETHCWDGPEYSLKSTQYETIQRHNSNPQDAMIFHVDDDSDCDHRTDNNNTHSMFISITNTQTLSHCDNYLLSAIRLYCPVIQYAHGLIVVDKHLGLMLKVEPGTASCKKWMTLDGGASGVHTFTAMEDGSRLLGFTRATGRISLQEWETLTGTLCYECIYSCPDFVYDPDEDFECHISPDSSKVAVSQSRRPFKTYILGITSGSSADIMDLMDARDVAWFPDSKWIAYFRSWQCGYRLCDKCHDLVVQCLASGQITTIHRWYYTGDKFHKVLITPDGSRLIIHEQKNDLFWTWDVSDL
ncbi:hypothetical protein EDD85DRAFT_954607 [Armillaria nabsnona]|nr:hypothetical protein EDD85DRAFT_954607 [Armillaria nabsnona]